MIQWAIKVLTYFLALKSQRRVKMIVNEELDDDLCVLVFFVYYYTIIFAA